MRYFIPGLLSEPVTTTNLKAPSSPTPDESTSSQPAKKWQYPRDSYERAWEEFLEFLRVRNGGADMNDDAEPTESDYVNYMEYLRNDRKWESSTFYTNMTKLNSMHLSRFKGERIYKKYPKIAALLKAYKTDYAVRSCKAFTVEDVQTFFRDPDLNSPYWILRKAAVAVGFCGRLKCSELWFIRMEDLKEVDEGTLVSMTIDTAQGGREEKSFLVPYYMDNPESSFDYHLRNYVTRMQEVLGETTGPLFRACREEGDYQMYALSKDKLMAVGKEVARCLNLPDSDCYFTANCFRPGTVARKTPSKRGRKPKSAKDNNSSHLEMEPQFDDNNSGDMAYDQGWFVP